MPLAGVCIRVFAFRCSHSSICFRVFALRGVSVSLSLQQKRARSTKAPGAFLLRHRQGSPGQASFRQGDFPSGRLSFWVTVLQGDFFRGGFFQGDRISGFPLQAKAPPEPPFRPKAQRKDYSTSRNASATSLSMALRVSSSALTNCSPKRYLLPVFLVQAMSAIASKCWSVSFS